eukprot:Plantae.Rhodophyta-Purpureofilum_apyrenoidigerum.ctg274.p1 GENE.Plantae.Rhodophyta-Purpureofilum_apyrenoidigerum.ctg274~~Plantae.Rhodophyta-Purpureofilum_apyrenoidigerum.ctg274.p1  ORF type:complete len:546 (-),score=100.14 Plantae.Rhodophyta-Purpureofilum_apyrenoidigerum.ctg274:24-1661(-)
MASVDDGAVSSEEARADEVESEDEAERETEVEREDVVSAFAFEIVEVEGDREVEELEDELVPLPHLRATRMQNFLSYVRTARFDGLGSPRGPSGAGNEEVISELKRGAFLTSEAVEESFRLCPREIFVPEAQKAHSYDMSPLRLTEYEFNISAPEVYANALEVLEFGKGHRFLDIGSGCGQLTAMGALLCGPTGSALGLDLSEKTVNFSRANIDKLKAEKPEFASGACEPKFRVCNVFLFDVSMHDPKLSDGRFDRIHCGANCPPQKLDDLTALLRPEGRLVTPCGEQMLLIKKEVDGSIAAKHVAAVRYGDLIVPSDMEIILHRYKLSITRASQNPAHQSSFAADLEKVGSVDEVKCLYLSPNRSDFAFIVANGSNTERIPAHKAVLRSRAGHFRGLFSANMGDSDGTETMFPEEFTKSSLLECLRYMYTDEANITDDNCIDILRLAKFYSISEGLFTLCENVLFEGVNVSNAASMLYLSSWYASTSLKRRTVQFILDNLAEVQKTDTWAELDRDLIEEILAESSRRTRMLNGLVEAAASSSRR